MKMVCFLYLKIPPLNFQLSPLFFVQSSFILFVSTQYSTVPDTLALFGIPYDQFHCGSGDDIKEAAITAINKSCPTLAPELNHCCAIHDDCYTNQRGQNNCDTTFCKCLERVALGESCQEFSTFTCSVVSLFGYTAYITIDKNFVYEFKTVPSVPSLLDDYMNLYEKCPYQNITISSCALNYNLCEEKKSTECAIRLIECLDGTELERNKSEQCDKAIKTIATGILSAEKTDVEEELSTISYIYPQAGDSGEAIFFNETFLVFFFIFAVLVIVFYIRGNSATSTVEPSKTILDEKRG
uniref:Phospholipase A(2) n=1 Tax=Caenorhabditis japonica TaxID=281687 RepID=A0A8R1DGP7_CAEJA